MSNLTEIIKSLEEPHWLPLNAKFMIIYNAGLRIINTIIVDAISQINDGKLSAFGKERLSELCLYYHYYQNSFIIPDNVLLFYYFPSYLPIICALINSCHYLTSTYKEELAFLTELLIQLKPYRPSYSFYTLFYFDYSSTAMKLTLNEKRIVAFYQEEGRITIQKHFLNKIFIDKLSTNYMNLVDQKCIDKGKKMVSYLNKNLIKKGIVNFMMEKRFPTDQELTHLIQKKICNLTSFKDISAFNYTPIGQQDVMMSPSPSNNDMVKLNKEEHSSVVSLISNMIMGDLKTKVEGLGKQVSEIKVELHNLSNRIKKITHDTVKQGEFERLNKELYEIKGKLIKYPTNNHCDSKFNNDEKSLLNTNKTENKNIIKDVLQKQEVESQKIENTIRKTDNNSINKSTITEILTKEELKINKDKNIINEENKPFVSHNNESSKGFIWGDEPQETKEPDRSKITEPEIKNKDMKINEGKKSTIGFNRESKDKSNNNNVTNCPVLGSKQTHEKKERKTIIPELEQNEKQINDDVSTMSKTSNDYKLSNQEDMNVQEKTESNLADEGTIPSQMIGIDSNAKQDNEELIISDTNTPENKPYDLRITSPISGIDTIIREERNEYTTHSMTFVLEDFIKEVIVTKTKYNVSNADNDIITVCKYQEYISNNDLLFEFLKKYFKEFDPTTKAAIVILCKCIHYNKDIYLKNNVLRDICSDATKLTTLLDAQSDIRKINEFTKQQNRNTLQ